jgi:hypothetical protein
MVLRRVVRECQQVGHDSQDVVPILGAARIEWLHNTVRRRKTQSPDSICNKRGRTKYTGRRVLRGEVNAIMARGRDVGYRLRRGRRYRQVAQHVADDPGRRAEEADQLALAPISIKITEKS